MLIPPWEKLKRPAHVVEPQRPQASPRCYHDVRGGSRSGRSSRRERSIAKANAGTVLIDCSTIDVERRAPSGPRQSRKDADDHAPV